MGKDHSSWNDRLLYFDRRICQRKSFFGYPAVILLIVIVDTEAELSYEKMFRWTVNTLAFTILILVVLDILQICDINHSYIRELIYRYGIGFIGKSENYAFYYKVFLRCSPLIIYTFAYAVFKKKRILSFMLFAALLRRERERT